MTSLSPQARSGTMSGMDAPIVEVDFHLKADHDHTYGLLAEVRPARQMRIGQRLLATDGDVTHWACVDEIDEEQGSMLLRVLWDEPVPAAS